MIRMHCAKWVDCCKARGTTKTHLNIGQRQPNWAILPRIIIWHFCIDPRVEKNKKKEYHHLTEAAIGGHPEARHNLGTLESERGMHERAVKHYIIAAKLGCDESLESVKYLYKVGRVSKDDFAAAIRDHQAAIDATKSPQREAGAKFARQEAEWHRRGIVPGS